MADIQGKPASTSVLVLYEDSYVVAVDKPAGIIVHGDGTGRQTLSDFVRDYLVRAGEQQAVSELQPLQRLDRETTGIVLFSKAKEMQAAFDALIAERGMEKRYLAVVCGRFPGGIKTYDTPIGRDRHDSRRMHVSRSGKSALTKAKRIAYAPADSLGPERSLLDVNLLTGRKHQIRVHLSNAGFPIIGDELYGEPTHRELERGLMLHASVEAFVHPVTGEQVRIESPYPVRFEELFPRE